MANNTSVILTRQPLCLFLSKAVQAFVYKRFKLSVDCNFNTNSVLLYFNVMTYTNGDSLILQNPNLQAEIKIKGLYYVKRVR